MMNSEEISSANDAAAILKRKRESIDANAVLADDDYDDTRASAILKIRDDIDDAILSGKKIRPEVFFF